MWRADQRSVGHSWVTNRRNTAKPNYHMSRSRSNRPVLWEINQKMEPEIHPIASSRFLLSTSNRMKFRLLVCSGFRHNMIVWFSWIFSICEIYWERKAYDCRSFSVLQTFTGSRPENSSQNRSQNMVSFSEPSVNQTLKTWDLWSVSESLGFS